MAFLKFSRDKRGVENFYLVEPTTNRRGKVRPRVLYWFRSPPDVKVGREPFDAAVRRALESQNPDISFDWQAIVETPIPSADADKWRERRRVERAAKYAAAEEELVDASNGEPDPTLAVVAALPDATCEISGAATSSAPIPIPDGPLSSRDVDGSSRDVNQKRRRRRRSGAGRGSPPPRTSAPSRTEPSGD